MFRVVDSAKVPPARCVVSNRADGPLVDCGVRFPFANPHVYLRVSVVEDLGHLVGMVPVRELDAANGRCVELEERVGGLEGEIDRLEKELEAVYVLRRSGFVDGKRPGRPRKEDD